jgi:hypothetical protein
VLKIYPMKKSLLSLVADAYARHTTTKHTRIRETANARRRVRLFQKT